LSIFLYSFVKDKKNKVMKILLNLPKITLIFLLVGFLYFLKAIVYIIYYSFEAPLNFLGGQIENMIRRLLKYVK